MNGLPWKRSAILQVEYLVRIEQVSKAGDELGALLTAALDVDEDEQRRHTVRYHWRLLLSIATATMAKQLHLVTTADMRIDGRMVGWLGVYLNGG